MSRVYDSLKGVVQETLQRGKPSAGGVARVKGSVAATLADDLGELEQAVADRIAHMKATVTEAEAVVNDEFDRAEQVIASLKQNIANLEAKLRDSEEVLEKKESAARKSEDNLAARVREIQAEMSNKEQTIERRTSEIAELKAKLEGELKRTAELETSIRQSSSELANEKKRIEQLEASHQARLHAAEELLRKSEQALKEKNSTLNAKQASLQAKIRQLEDEIGAKDQLLASRDGEIHDLKSQLQTLTQGIKQMSAFFKRAEALESGGEENGKAQPDLAPVKEPQLKEPSTVDRAKRVNDAAAPKQTVSAQFFKRVKTELTHSLGPMAAMIVEDHVAALGESMEQFPSERVSELIEIVSQEIADDRQKIAFKVRIGAAV